MLICYAQLDNARSQTCISYELYDSLLSQRPDSAGFQRSIASNQRIRHPNIDGHYLTVVDVILILLGLVGFSLVVDRFSCFLVPGLPSASLLRYIARPHLVHDLLRFVLSTAPAQPRPVADLLVSFSLCHVFCHLLFLVVPLLSSTSSCCPIFAVTPSYAHELLRVC